MNCPVQIGLGIRRFGCDVTQAGRNFSVLRVVLIEAIFIRALTEVVKIGFLLCCLLFSIPLNAQDHLPDSSLVPLSTIFYKAGDHLLGSVVDNSGLNYVLAGVATYGIVRSGFDWRWYRNAQDHKWISNAGFVSVAVGPLASVGVPLGLYLCGRSERDTRLQVTGLALGQSVILSTVMTSVLKAFTGRMGPDRHNQKNDYSTEFRFGFLRGGVYEGWPSSHTAAAFSMAATLIELYPGNSAVKIGSLAYASLIGIGVSTNIHWFSDAVAGGLIGYAIGETVGKGYRELLGGEDAESSFSLSVTPTRIGFTYRF